MHLSLWILPIVCLLYTSCALDICVELIGKEHQAKVRIAGFHTNIVFIEKDHDVIFEMGVVTSADQSLTDRSLLNIHDIYEFANNVELDQVKDLLQRQIDYCLLYTSRCV